MNEEKDVLNQFFEKASMDLPVMIAHEEETLRKVWTNFIHLQPGRPVYAYSSPEELLANVRETIGRSRGALAILHIGEDCSGLTVAKQLSALSNNVALVLVGSQIPSDEVLGEISELGMEFFQVNAFQRRLLQAIETDSSPKG